MAVEGALGCVGGCLVGAAGLLAAQRYRGEGRRVKRREDANGGLYPTPPLRPGGASRSDVVSRADSTASFGGRFPYASPADASWRKYQSPRMSKGAAALGKASLTREKADLNLVGDVSKALDREAFIDVLGKLIGQSRQLQNNPRLKVTPQEKLAADIVKEELRQYSSENGGPLIVEELEYVSGRSNLKVTYPGETQKTISFVGSHFDVVPADAEAWKVDPFALTVEDDKLYGRGTTDCLGHVALITRFLVELGKARPKLQHSIIVCFIAGEEGGETGVGVDKVVEAGKLAECKQGPVYWVDTADSNPCCGTSGVITWTLTAKGRLFHSGFPSRGINSIELLSDAVAAIQERFYDDFPLADGEAMYQFDSGSSMKPTQIECKKGSLNQICPEATAHGDIRLSPFWDVEEVVKAVEEYVKDINQSIDIMPNRGPYSHYVLDDKIEVADNELRQGRLEVKWGSDKHARALYEGIACDLDSAGHKALVQAVRETNGEAKPFSVNGSLPLVRQMQKAGFDLQLCGFGLMKVYHGVDEYCTFSAMAKAYEVLLRVICLMEAGDDEMVLKY